MNAERHGAELCGLADRRTENPMLRQRSRRGLSVAFLGPDGSGKTTLARALQQRLAAEFSGTMYYHAAFGVLPLLRVLRGWLPGRSDRPATATSGAQPDGRGMVPALGPLRSLSYIAYYAIDCLLGGLAMKRATARGCLVVLDRWFADYLVQRAHRRAPRTVVYALASLLPQPDLIVLLSGSARTLHDRKPELSIAEIARQCRILEDLAARFPGSLLLRTDRPTAQTLAELESAIRRLRGCRARAGHGDKERKVA